MSDTDDEHSLNIVDDKSILDESVCEPSVAEIESPTMLIPEGQNRIDAPRLITHVRTHDGSIVDDRHVSFGNKPDNIRKAKSEFVRGYDLYNEHPEGGGGGVEIVDRYHNTSYTHHQGGQYHQPYSTSTRPGDSVGKSRTSRGFYEFDNPVQDYNNSLGHHGYPDGRNYMGPEHSTRSGWSSNDPVIAVATAVVEDDLEKKKQIEEENIKNSRRIQRLLICILVVLISIAGGTAIYAWQNGLLGEGETENPTEVTSPLPPGTDDGISTTDDSGDLNLISPNPSNSSDSPTALSSLGFPSVIPTSIPTYSSTTLSPTQTPTIKEVTSAPSSPYPTSQPNPEPSSYPSFIPTNTPTMRPTPAPTRKSPTPQPTKGCKAWCANHPKPWYDLAKPDDPQASKCKWPVNCAGCDACLNPPIISYDTDAYTDNDTDNDEVSSLPSVSPSTTATNPACLTWCPNHEESWEVKCTWPVKCAGCPECSNFR